MTKKAITTSRVRGEDLKSSVFTTKQNETKTPTMRTASKSVTIKGETNYCFIGNEDSFDDGGYPVVNSFMIKEKGNAIDDRVCARQLISKRNTKNLVRIGTDGFFYNPTGIHGTPTRRRVVREPQFVEVNEQAFQYYLDFLLTKSQRSLKFAQKIAI